MTFNDWINSLLGPSPYRKPYEQLRFVGLTQECAQELIADLTKDHQGRPRHDAVVNLAVAIEFGKVGLEGNEIREAVESLHWILDAAQIAPHGFATQEQLLAAVPPVAYIRILTGNRYFAPQIIQSVANWLRGENA